LDNNLSTKVSCNQSGLACTIVGSVTADDGEMLPLLYITHDAGQKWISFNTLKSASYFFPGDIPRKTPLNGISCDRSGNICIAVGYTFTSNSFFSSIYSSKPVVYSTQDGGAHWSDPVILPTDVNDFTGSTLTDVACDDSGMQCTTIGYTEYFNINQQQLFSFTTYNGGLSWESKKFIQSRNTSENYLGSLHCDDSGLRCTAVGWHMPLITTIPVYQPLVYTTIDGAKHWEKNINTSFPISSILYDVSCSNTGDNCVAVGVKAEVNNALTAQAKKAFKSLQINGLTKPEKSLESSY